MVEEHGWIIVRREMTTITRFFIPEDNHLDQKKTRTMNGQKKEDPKLI